MIRGQPRAHPVSSRSTVSPVQYQYPNTHNPIHPDTGSDETDEYAYDQSASTNTSPSYPPIQIPQLTPGSVSFPLLPFVRPDVALF